MEKLNARLIDGETIALGHTGSPIGVDKILVADITAEITSANPDDIEFESAIKASKVIQDLTFTADVAGVVGNSTTIEYVETGAASEVLAVDVTDTAITVTLASDAGTASSLVVQDLTYTADAVGVAGDNITIAYVADGTAGSETVDVTGTDIVVHMDDTAVTGSTATQIAAAIDGSAPASALLSVAVTGTGSNVQAAAAAAPLENGVDPAVTSDADAIKAAIEGEAAAAALVDITVSGTGSNVQAAAASAALEGGLDKDVNLTTFAITQAAHGFTTGMKCTLTTSDADLPAPLATATPYYIIAVDANTFQLAESQALALAGTEIEISDYGTGTHTVVVDTTLTGTIKLQKSNDDGNWVDIGSSSKAISATSVQNWKNSDLEGMGYAKLRAVVAMTSGTIDVTCTFNGKGN